MPYDDQCGFTSNRNISYSYQHQTRIETLGFSLSLLDESDRVIMADKNPLTLYQGSFAEKYYTTFYRMQGIDLPHDSMSVNHGSEGQNVLKLGGVVEFTTSVTSGSEGDNIWDPASRTVGSLKGNRLPQSSEDIFLVP